MIGIVKTVVERGFGFISVEGLELDLFFHSSELNGVTFDELKEGDALNFDTELIPRKRASPDTIRHGQLVLPHEEQKIIPPNSLKEVKLQNKITAELVARLSRNPADLYQLTANDFEELISELYRVDGYSVESVGSWNQADGGVDIVVMKCDIGSGQFRMAIQCKRYARTKRVSAAPIRALAGVLDRFRAHAGALITTSDFTKPAKREAEAFFWRLSLKNYENVVDMLRHAELLMPPPPITFSPIEPPAPPAPPIAQDIPEMFMNAINVSRA